ncbi:M28 family peptidase [Chloroflexota bacterium]
MSQLGEYSQEALEHIRYLSVIIGGRGSCTPSERRAAEYAAEQMSGLGLSDVQIEPYKGSPSTYRPYALALGVAIFATLLMWLVETPWALAIAAILNALAAWGTLAETDLAANWMRWVLPKADSQNAVGRILPTGQVRKRAVICAHVDTHRTPSFYASPTRFALFRGLMIGAWAGMIIEAAFYALAIVFSWDWIFWVGALATLQVIALDMCLHADRTPFSPGANDNASGVAVALGLARRLSEEPLSHTEVWVAFTGCEETAAYGMGAFLRAHGDDLGDDAVYIVLDMVAQGPLTLPTSDGLLIKHKVHACALDLARQADEALPNLQVRKQVGLAYTDATLATKQGRIALTVNALPPPGEQETAQWHRMSDTSDKLDSQILAEAHTFTWQVLVELDQS